MVYSRERKCLPEIFPIMVSQTVTLNEPGLAILVARAGQVVCLFGSNLFDSFSFQCVDGLSMCSDSLSFIACPFIPRSHFTVLNRHII